jgi:hypothetical protein
MAQHTHNPGHHQPGCDACEQRLQRIERRSMHQPGCPARNPELDDADCDAECGLVANEAIDAVVRCDDPFHSHASLEEARACVRPQLVRTDPEFAQVWCDKCDQPATNDILLTSGDRAFRCSTHAWLILAPRGQKVPVQA